MIAWFCKWYLRSYINDLENKWWVAGVNQQLHEPETAWHGHMSHSKYWTGEEE